MLDRTQIYLDRLEKHLAGLSSNAARAAFIAAELDKWEARYSLFTESVDAGTYTGEATAFDYSETIAALGAVAGRYKREAA